MKLQLTLLFVPLFYVNMNAQVPETHMALATPKTATWCEPCGEWGVESTEIMVEESMDKAVFIELHNSDDLSNTTNDAILADFPYTAYTPAWYVNGLNVTYAVDGGGQIPTYTEQNVKSAIDSTYEVPPVANSIYEFTLSGNELTVNTQTKFFQSTEGDYYLAVYVVENDVDEDQDGAPANFLRDFTLRTGMTAGNHYGELVASGVIAAGTEYEDTYTVTLDNDWVQSHIWLATVIWQNNGGIYSYVNAFTDYGRIAVGVEELVSADFEIQLINNPAQYSAQLQVGAINYLENVQIQLTDLQGRILQTIYNGTMLEGNHIIDINLENISSGMYLVNTISGQHQNSQSLVVVK